MLPCATNFGYLTIFFAFFPSWANARATYRAHTQLLEVRDANITQTNSSKTGLGWPNADTVDITQFTSTGNTSWYYTWSAFPTKADIEFVPMFWGNKSIDGFSSIMAQTLADKQINVTALLGMNEPELAGQAQITPQEGAELWKSYVQPFHDQGLRLGSPAPSSSPTGKIWLQDFLSACVDNCTVDFIALHWYGTNATQFISYIEDFNNTFQRPLWVTEWACQNFVDFNAQCSADDVVEFLNATQTYMDNSDFVERYAWFGAMKVLQGIDENNALMDANGKINSLGQQYIRDENKLVVVSASVSNGRAVRFTLSSPALFWAGPMVLMLLVSFSHLFWPT